MINSSNSKFSLVIPVRVLEDNTLNKDSNGRCKVSDKLNA